MFKETKCGNVGTLIINNISCTAGHYSFLQILYSLMMAYLRAETCSCRFSVINTVHVVFQGYLLIFM